MAVAAFEERLTPLTRLKYHGSIADAVADHGRPDAIGKIFTDIQKYLYQDGDLRPARQLGVEVLQPREFLAKLRL